MKKIKNTILYLFLFVNLTSFSVYADSYSFMDLQEMMSVCKVEYIFEGKIKDVLSNKSVKYEISVMNELFGSLKKQNIEVHFFLPSIKQDNILIHKVLPGSGIEQDLEKEDVYIFFINKLGDKYELLRAEPKEKKDLIIELITYKAV